MQKFRDTVRNLFARVEPLPAGSHHFQSPPEAALQYRLHLRLEPDGSGLLIVNAHTVLHLNQTAAEYAYHLVNGTPPDQVAAEMEHRYQVTREQALADFHDLSNRIQILIYTPDLDPVSYLDFERRDPYITELSAPYRLDCAITYRLPVGEDVSAAPTERVAAELSTEDWKAILQKAWDAGIPQIVFTGGEPTLREDLPELIAFTQKIGQVSGLLTDGSQFVFPGNLDRLLQGGLDHILLVLHPETEASWQALQTALAADIFVTAHLTVTTDNQTQVDAYLQRLAEMGVKSLSLSTTDASLTPVLQIARDRAAALLLSLVWDLPVPYSHLHPVALEKDETVPDGAGKAWLYVEPDGDVLPAQGVNRVLGNFLHDPWEAIWKNR